MSRNRDIAATVRRHPPSSVDIMDTTQALAPVSSPASAAAPQTAPSPPPGAFSTSPPLVVSPYPLTPPMNGLAIAALVLGLCGFSLLPVIFGHVALNQIRRRGERGGALAIVGLVLGYLQIGAIVVALLVVSLGGWGIFGAILSGS